MEVPGRRPKKNWKRCIEEDMEDLGIENTAENRDEWRKAIARTTPIEETGRKTKMMMDTSDQHVGSTLKFSSIPS